MNKNQLIGHLALLYEDYLLASLADRKHTIKKMDGSGGQENVYFKGNFHDFIQYLEDTYINKKL